MLQIVKMTCSSKPMYTRIFVRLFRKNKLLIKENGIPQLSEKENCKILKISK